MPALLNWLAGTAHLTFFSPQTASIPYNGNMFCAPGKPLSIVWKCVFDCNRLRSSAIDCNWGKQSVDLSEGVGEGGDEVGEEEALAFGGRRGAAGGEHGAQKGGGLEGDNDEKDEPYAEGEGSA